MLSHNSLPQALSENPRLSSWFEVLDHNTLTLKSGKIEIGQGIHLALRQIAAEELDVELDRINVIAGDTSLVPNEGGTFASLSMMTSGPAVRIAAAELRGVATEIAATRLSCDPSELSISNGTFHRNSVPTAETYWTCLPSIDPERSISGKYPPKRAEHYQIVGRSPRADHLSTRIGGGAFIQDLRLEGMLHGRALRQPFWGAALSSVDVDKVKLRPGVVSVLIDGSFVGLITETEAQLGAAMEQLDRSTKWEADPDSDSDRSAIDYLDLGVYEPLTVRDDFETTPNWQYQETFTKPLLAHGSIGPSCAIACFQNDRLKVWTHSQNIFEMRRQFSRILRISEKEIEIKHVLGAGCYGHNGADDVAMDAVLLARAVPGKPVRVQWSRRDELAAEPFGSPMRVSVSASLTDGRISAWQLKTRSGTHVQRPGWAGEVNLLGAAAISDPWPFKPGVDCELSEGGGGGAKNSVAGYDFPQNVSYELVPEFPFRLSALRSLGAFANVIAIESAIDDLAILAEVDPIEFRLSHLQNERAISVISTVKEMSGWDQPCRDGTAKGIGYAQFENELSYCAVVAHVAVEEDVQLIEIWAAVDAGLAVDPSGIKAQVEGGIIQAASWVLKEAVPTNGRQVTSETWQDYPILRFEEAPEVNVSITSNSGDPSMGVGEVSLAPAGAAIANAVNAALGVRIRNLPITRDRIISAIMDS